MSVSRLLILDKQLQYHITRNADFARADSMKGMPVMKDYSGVPLCLLPMQ
jgi:hypothetical protein